MDSRRFIPTDIGKIVNRFLTKNFHRYVEYGFTARMEDALDAISRGEEEWVPLMHQFWKPFISQVRAHREARHARRSRAGTRSRHRSGLGQAGERAHGPLRPVRADGHQGRRGEAALRRAAAGAEDGQGHARRCDGAVQAAARPRTDADGEPVLANVGRFGPYIKYGAKYVSLKEDDPYTVELPRALELIEQKKRRTRIASSSISPTQASRC